MGSAVTMVEVETEMAWTGEMVKAEALLSAIEGQDFADIEHLQGKGQLGADAIENAYTAS